MKTTLLKFQVAALLTVFSQIANAGILDIIGAAQNIAAFWMVAKAPVGRGQTTEEDRRRFQERFDAERRLKAQAQSAAQREYDRYISDNAKLIADINTYFASTDLTYGKVLKYVFNFLQTIPLDRESYKFRMDHEDYYLINNEKLATAELLRKAVPYASTQFEFLALLGAFDLKTSQRIGHVQNMVLSENFSTFVRLDFEESTFEKLKTLNYSFYDKTSIEAYHKLVQFRLGQKAEDFLRFAKVSWLVRANDGFGNEGLRGFSESFQKLVPDFLNSNPTLEQINEAARQAHREINSIKLLFSSGLGRAKSYADFKKLFSGFQDPNPGGRKEQGTWTQFDQISNRINGAESVLEGIQPVLVETLKGLELSSSDLTDLLNTGLLTPEGKETLFSSLPGKRLHGVKKSDLKYNEDVEKISAAKRKSSCWRFVFRLSP